MKLSSQILLKMFNPWIHSFICLLQTKAQIIFEPPLSMAANACRSKGRLADKTRWDFKGDVEKKLNSSKLNRLLCHHRHRIHIGPFVEFAFHTKEGGVHSRQAESTSHAHGYLQRGEGPSPTQNVSDRWTPADYHVSYLFGKNYSKRNFECVISALRDFYEIWNNITWVESEEIPKEK